MTIYGLLKPHFEVLEWSMTGDVQEFRTPTYSTSWLASLVNLVCQPSHSYV